MATRLQARKLQAINQPAYQRVPADSVAQFCQMAEERPWRRRPEYKSLARGLFLNLGRVHLAELFQLQAQTMAQRALSSQFIQ
jgi:hypothetical protein